MRWLFIYEDSQFLYVFFFRGELINGDFDGGEIVIEDDIWLWEGEVKVVPKITESLDFTTVWAKARYSALEELR